MRLLFVCLGVFISIWSAVAAAEEVIVGAALPLSGKLAFVGQSQLHGLEFAVEKINNGAARGGRQFRLVVEDNTGETSVAPRAALKLLEADGARILFSSTTHLTQAIKGVAKAKNAMLIYQAGLGDIAKESPLFFRDWIDSTASGAFLAREVAARGYQTLAVLSDNNDACAELEQSFRQTAAGLKLSIVAADTFNSGESDFRTLLLRLSKSTPDAYVMCAFRDAGVIMKQMKETGLIGTRVFHVLAPYVPMNDAPQIRKLYEENRSLSLWIGFPPDELDAAQKEFAAAFQNRFGSSPRPEAMLFYDDMLALADSMSKCLPSKALDLQCAAENLRRSPHNGLTGKFSFNESGLSSRRDFLIEVHNAQWRRAQ